jgi:hypothetical protein
MNVFLSFVLLAGLIDSKMKLLDFIGTREDRGAVANSNEK